MNSNPPDPDPPDPSLRWLSQDYRELQTETDDDIIDVLIVGSGYGGGMAAAELAGMHLRQADGTLARARVCVLERGREYAPGMFPSSLQELPPNVRVHRSSQDKTIGPLDALLDVRIGADVCALVGNGLGGTSLINAGVMATPRLGDCERLPPRLRRALTPTAFRAVRARLGATKGLAQHPDLPPGGLPKTQALQNLARQAGVNAEGQGLECELAHITVQMPSDAADPQVPPCTLCGDCMTGCNVGAKKSVDTTLLREAWRKGAEIYTGGSVLEVRKDDRKRQPHGNGGANGTDASTQGAIGEPVWIVKTVYTDESLRRRHSPKYLRARHVILAAGTLGSTEILLRSRSYSLALSRKLGEQFSCNGDNLVAIQDEQVPAHTTTDEFVPLQARRIGPTITASIDLNGMLVQEFAVPAALKRLFDETVTTARLFQDLAEYPARSRPGGDGWDSFQIDAKAMDRTLLVGLIAHDESCGQLQLAQAPRMDDSRHLEGRVRIHWPDVRKSYMMDRGFEIARALVTKARGTDAHFLPNPLWRLLPDNMEFLVKGERGPLLTVHPLGGCPMGETHEFGVVDDIGRVFDRARAEDAASRGKELHKQPVHHGLAVLDGSIIPASLGANPALTIATVARRAARKLAATWGLRRVPVELDPVRPRPVFREPQHCTPPTPKPTEVQLVERLVGEAGDKLVEVTLRYHPEAVHKLMRADRPVLRVREEDSLIRIYDKYVKDAPRGEPPGEEHKTTRQIITWSEAKRDQEALMVARVGGSLDMLRQIPSGDLSKVAAAWAWLRNRGTRELWDYYVARTTPQRLGAKQFWPSAARAGEIREFTYEVRMGQVLKSSPGHALPSPGATLRGRKRLTYGRSSNPWRQLREMQLTAWPAALGPGMLELDCRFLAGQTATPLLRITKQENQIVALADLAAWAACWVRMLVSIHLWSFRAPDPAPPRVAQRLPVADPKRLPAPEITEIELEPPRRGLPVRLRLTRYRGRDGARPVALIHGYSASGSTFTHEAIPKPLALHLHERGMDVWVLDLRTSAGMPSAVLPWNFEDAAFADIPVAIAHIKRVTRAPQVDVVAHCIGAVMLGMALLTDKKALRRIDRLVEPADGGPMPRRYEHELAVLGKNIGRIVLMQKAPVLVYTDDNVLRAYFMQLLRRVILPEDYHFEVPTEQSGVASGLLDRILATLPYPDDDFRRENPMWPPWKRAPWAGFRHRMDALYARDFSLKNVEDRTLEAIANLFGPLNLDTVSQAIHFARFNTITDGSGRAIDTRGATLRERWPRNGTLSIHGVENGLADVATVQVWDSHLKRAGVPLEKAYIPGYGHQDCLIGRNAERDVFRHISSFLQAQAGIISAPSGELHPAPLKAART